MKYMLLIYGENKAHRSEKEREDCKNEAVKLAEDLRAKGQYVAANPLEPTTTATSIRVRDGKRLVTDGPFAETHEQLGGYFLIEVKNLDEALVVAHKIPMAVKGTIEDWGTDTGYVLGVGLSGQEISRPRGSSRSKSSARRRKEGRHSDLPLFVYLAMPCH